MALIQKLQQTQSMQRLAFDDLEKALANSPEDEGEKIEQ